MENRKPLTPKAAGTRRKLLTATLEQIAAHGYHDVTVDDIAKACGLSTGCAYRYFRNKKEMLLAAIETCYENIRTLTGTQETRLAEFGTPEEMLGYVLQQFCRLHRTYAAIHEELESLRHIDPDVRALYEKIQSDAVCALIARCPPALAALPDLQERLYAAIGILENCAHLQMYDPPADLDPDQFEKISIRTVRMLFP